MDQKLLIDKISENVAAMLKDYQDEIGKAYLKCENNKALTVSLGFKLKPNKKGPGIIIESGLSLVTERIKDKVVTVFNPNQKEITFPKGEKGTVKK